MLKNKLGSAIFAAPLAAAFLFASTALAAAPTLSLSPSGGDSVSIIITGDANSSVMLFYNLGSTSGMQTRTLGTTDASGHLTVTLSSGATGILSGYSTYAIVNGQQSSVAPWPTTGSGSASTGALSLSQNSMTLLPGQATTLFVSGGSNTFFISNNSNPSVATFMLSGTQLTATGAATGSATATICDQNNLSSCVILSVTTVQGSGTSASASGVTFSQNNVNVNSGSGTIIISLYGGSNYTITSNSNPSAVNASIYGSSVDLMANGSTPASATLTVCSSGTSSCGTLNVGVNGGGNFPTSNTNTATTPSVTFSQSNPSLTAGQTLIVTVSGGSGTYFVSANPSPSVASAVLNGASLALSGLASGSDTVTVCASSGGCASLTATVSGSSQVAASVVSLSQTNVALAVGQSVAITISGGAGSYFLSSSPSTVAQATISANTLTLVGQTPGSFPFSVCSSSGGCSVVLATVNAAPPTTVINNPITPTAAPLNTSTLTSILAQIQQLTNLLVQLEAQAIAQLQQFGAGAVSGVSAARDATASYKFSSYLTLGSTGAEVSALQQRLTAEGFYSGTVSGVYSASTESAVAAYQAKHGISPLGVVGPATRNALNGY